MAIDFLMNFLARDNVSMVYTRLTAAQKELSAAIRNSNVSGAELEARLSGLARQGGFTEKFTQGLTRWTLKEAEAFLLSSEALAGKSMVMLQATARTKALEAQTVRLAIADLKRVAASESAGAEQADRALGDMEQLLASKQLEAQQARMNVDIVEHVAALRLQSLAAEQGAVAVLDLSMAVKTLSVEEAQEILVTQRGVVASIQKTIADQQRAIAGGRVAAVEGLVAISQAESNLQIARGNVVEAQAALQAVKHAVAKQAVAVATTTHTAAVQANTEALVGNRWLGVSMGNVFEKLGAGARLSGFDVGFMAMHLGLLGIGAAVATASLGLLADETSSIEQLRFGVENLGLTWDEARFGDLALELRDATGNTVVEIREVMATLTAVTGGLIHSEEELQSHAKLTLDVMRRTGASAQLASRIVARTLAGNLESLRERFPGLTFEIERLRDSGASLEELGDWGMRQLRQQVGGAASEISEADRLSAGLRNSLIQIGLGIATSVYPALVVLGKGVRLVADAVSILSPALPILVGGLVAAKIAAWAYAAAATGATVASMGFYAALVVLTSPFLLITGAVLATAGAVVGVAAAIRSMNDEIQNARQLKEFTRSLRLFSRFSQEAGELTVKIDEVAVAFARLQSQNALDALVLMLRDGRITVAQFTNALRGLHGGTNEAVERLRFLGFQGYLAANDLQEGLRVLQPELFEIGRGAVEVSDVFEKLSPAMRATSQEVEQFTELMNNMSLQRNEVLPFLDEFFGVFQANQRTLTSTVTDLERMRRHTEAIARIEFGAFTSSEDLVRTVRERQYEAELQELVQQIERGRIAVDQELARSWNEWRSLDSEQRAERYNDIRDAFGDEVDLFDRYNATIVEHEYQAELERRRAQEDAAEDARTAAERALREQRRLFDRALEASQDSLASAQQEAEEAANRVAMAIFQRRQSIIIKGLEWEEQQWQASLDRIGEMELRALIEAEENAKRRMQLLAVLADMMQRVANKLQLQQDAEAAAKEARKAEFEGFISGMTSIGRSIGGIMEEALGQKGLIWWIEGLGQAAYAIANWMHPFAAAQHAAAAAAFFYAASQANKATGSSGGGRGSSRRAATVARRRQTLEEAPDARLRSPSGLVFAQYNDLRGAIMPSRRAGYELMDVINRGVRFRSGRRFGGDAVQGWRR